MAAGNNDAGAANSAKGVIANGQSSLFDEARRVLQLSPQFRGQPGGNNGQPGSKTGRCAAVLETILLRYLITCTHHKRFRACFVVDTRNPETVIQASLQASLR